MVKKSRKSAGEVTNKMLLEHFQAGMTSLDIGLRGEMTGLRGELKRVEKSLKDEIRQLDERIRQCERNDEKTHLALQRLYEKRVEVVEKIEDHEKRIKIIEKELSAAMQ